jgi:hypothetical protein
MITALYFCWRADLVSQSSDAWASATDEYSDMDGPTRDRDRLCPRWLYIVLVSRVLGGPENTGAAMHLFCTWIVTIGWRKLLETHRNLTK